MKKILSFALALVLAVGLLPNTARAAVQPSTSKNINTQTYYFASWAQPINSYLFENSTGGLTRVENTSTIIVEDYDSQFHCQTSRTIPKELPIWGGFFAGENCNFFVFGQKNEEENDSKEVIRVVKYSKDWQRLGAASLYGANTTVPFDAGTLRCDEYGGYLYVRTCHKMYTSRDGKNHQANMMFAVRQGDMTVTDSFSGVEYMDYGYTSHSFNQFVLVDQSGNIVTLDQGDGYPRALTLFRYNTKAGQDKFLGGKGERKSFRVFPGEIGYNYTGAAVGGFAETANGYVTAYNYDGARSTAGNGGYDRDVYLAFVDKNLSDVKTTQISSGFNTSAPQMVSTGLDGGYIMWNGRLLTIAANYDSNLYYARYDANGNVEPAKLAAAHLSDCAPICWNSKVVWYVTNNSVPVFYTLDESGVTPHQADGGNDASASGIACASTQTVLLNGKRVTFQAYALKNGSGGMTNYVKLRDLAYYLNGTKAQFTVAWSAARRISVSSGRPYTPNGSELSTPFSGDRSFKAGMSQTEVNSGAVNLGSIVLTDDNGGSYTYYKLRDLGRSLYFNVSYINGQVVINTNEPYSDAQ